MQDGTRRGLRLAAAQRAAQHRRRRDLGSLHHGGGVGMGYSQHAGVVIVCDGTDAAAKRIERVLWNDPATGVMRHADAGYEDRHRLRARAGPEPADAATLRWRRPLTDARARSRRADARRSCRRCTPARVALAARPAACGRRSRASAARRAARRRGRRAGLRRQHRLRQAGQPRASPTTDLAQLQLNLIRSHSVGVGEPLPAPVRAPDAGAEGGEPGARPLGRARRRSSTRCSRCTTPASCRVPSPGLGRRVGRPGAAGAPDAGADRRGRVRRRRRAPCRPPTALRSAGIAPLHARGQGRPGADQRHAGLDRAGAARAASRSSRCSRRRWSIGALTVDAARGSDGPFDPRIHALRGQPGQIDVARYYRALLAGSEIRRSHLRGRRPRAGPVLPALPAAGGGRLPRPAAPRRAGAGARGQRRHRQPAGVRRRRRRDRSSRGGNFHAEPVALAADALARRDRRGRRDRRAPHRDADRRRRLAPAAVPDAPTPG